MRLRESISASPASFERRVFWRLKAMKPHPDPHYYDCSHPDSNGQKTFAGKMEFLTYDRKKEAVYQCSVPTCGRKANEIMLSYDYNQYKKR
jgi:hypothetical protein